MDLIVGPRGVIRGLYGEAIDLARLGAVALRRAGRVEPDADGRWHADLAPLGGPVLGPFDRRSQAVRAEEAWVAGVWLPAPPL